MGQFDKWYCEECGGWLDRPGLMLCKDPRHPAPTLAQRISATIEHDLNGRKGMGLFDVDEETQYAIRDAWAARVQKVLDGPEKQ